MQSRCNQAKASHREPGGKQPPVRGLLFNLSVSLAAVALFSGIALAGPLTQTEGPAAGPDAGLEVVQQPDEGAGPVPPRFQQRRRFMRRQWMEQGFPGGPGYGEEVPAGQGRNLETGVPGAFPMGGPGRFAPGRVPGAGRFRGRPATPGAQMFGGPLDLTPLGLSEEQKDRIRQIRSQSAVKARELRRVLKLKRAEMKDLMFDPDASDAQIKARRQELRRLQDQLEDVILSDFLALRGVLTAEQRQRLPEVKPQPRPPLAGRGLDLPGRRLPGPPLEGAASERFGRRGAPAAERFGGPGAVPPEAPLD
ncbi:MAG TPA: Spy/CpxP family protein refolding chaperone [Candidatus Obscuribacterales bacterium]